MKNDQIYKTELRIDRLGFDYVATARFGVLIISKYHKNVKQREWTRPRKKDEFITLEQLREFAKAH